MAPGGREARFLQSACPKQHDRVTGCTGRASARLAQSRRGREDARRRADDEEHDMMNITVVNRSHHIDDAELQAVIRAVNRQIAEDFAPHWGLTATLRLEGRVGRCADKTQLPELRGDAALYLWDKVDMANALGYHQTNGRHIPYGFVFTELAEQLKEDWSVVLSHEALELLADPLANLVVQAPHPHESRHVYYWYEVADPVQNDNYKIDSVAVSNFVLPLYFAGHHVQGRTDFLGLLDEGRPLGPLDVRPGGYLGYFDPKLGKTHTITQPDDARARERLHAKRQAGSGRRALRIERPHDHVPADAQRRLEIHAE
jgi:hypothetical protein